MDSNALGLYLCLPRAIIATASGSADVAAVSHHVVLAYDCNSGAMFGTRRAAEGEHHVGGTHVGLLWHRSSQAVQQ
jgi:hypothetical protein